MYSWLIQEMIIIIIIIITIIIIMVSTLDSESSDPSSNLGETSNGRQASLGTGCCALP